MQIESAIAAFVSTGLISLAPNIILLLFPNYSSQSSASEATLGSAILSLGQALAAGGLLGDVFLHTLPHAFEDNGHDGGGNSLGLVVLAGFSTFFILDVLIRSTGHTHSHDHSHDHSNDHSNDHYRDRSHRAQANGTAAKKEVPSECQPLATFTPTVILNLAADSLHNFTDGLAIGASFAASFTSRVDAGSGGGATTSAAHFISTVATQMKSRGGLATVSVMFHEIPHELGDFAILVGHGFSKGEAIRAQFVTALAAFLGTFVGLVAAHVEGLGHSMLPFTSGGFVYLAACNILPELLEAKASPILRIMQITFFGFGIAFMQAVSFLEDEGGHGGHHGHGHHHHYSSVCHDHHHEEL